MISIWDRILDVVLVLLLTGTLVMAVRLDRALRVVRRDRAAFEALISNLGSATTSVKVGIQALRNEADRAAEQIERRSEDADKLATDLSFLIDAANRASSRLEEERQSAPPKSRPNAPGTADLGAAGQPPGVQGGLRKLAGIGQRRRGRVPDATPAPRSSDQGTPELAAAEPVPNEQDATSIMMEG